MLTKKSKSTRTEAGVRPAFTLLELMIAMSLGLIVSGMVLYGYMGANKSQALAVGSNLLKTSGIATMNAMYRVLNQTRRIYDRGATTDALLGMVPIVNLGGTLSPGLNDVLTSATCELVLPKADTTGSFVAQLADAAGNPVAGANALFNGADVGNALFVLAVDPRVVIADDPATNLQQAAFGSATYQIDCYRFHLYYLTHRALPLGAPPVRRPDTYTYQLNHWDSAVYLDKGQLNRWMRVLTARHGAAAQTFITTKLTRFSTVMNYAKAFDLSGTTPANSFNDLATTDYQTLSAATWPTGTPVFTSGHFQTAIKFAMRTSFGESFVAFNSLAGGTNAAVVIRSMTAQDYNVPALATDASKPYGFEVMVAGQPSSRKVLLRLVLSARAMPGNVLMAEPFQQVVRVTEF